MMTNLFRSPRTLRGRAILITGGGSGIGRATALACAEAGMRVIVTGRRAQKLDEVVSHITTRDSAALAIRADVNHREEVERMFEEAIAWSGGLDVVFANAGFGVYAPISTVDEDLVRSMFQTNFYGSLYCAQSAIGHFKARMGTKAGMETASPDTSSSARVPAFDGGHLLFCISALSEIGLPYHGIYSATKAAQDALAGALRAEVAPLEICISSVHPIGTQTEFFDIARQQGSESAPTPRGEAKPHTPELVARSILRCLRRPVPEVWPSGWTRLALALLTAWPGLSAWAMARHARKTSGPET
ncbi:MAG: SDR family NAD(P)-dependent oxidoreductase [Phycisphaeraceae bacterium]|nr:SDR family NAD(P)-dependent oxidoreductase [Phycisphaeraceae bacterium]